VSEAELAELRPAGLGWRLGARLVDVTVLAWALVILLVEVVGRANDTITTGAVATVGGGLLVATELIPTATAGLTAGKFLLGLRVVSIHDGRPPGFGRALARSALLFVPLLYSPLPGWLAVIPPIVVLAPIVIDRRHRGLHDRLGSTIVVFAPDRHGDPDDR